MKTGKVGQRIKAVMEKKGVTREELSQRTGIGTDMIRLIEEVGMFLDDQVSREPLIIRRRERTRELSMLRAKTAPVALQFYSLGRGKTDRHMEPFFVELLPESAVEKNLSSHEGEEFIVVDSGRIEIIYGREVHQLEAGDSIYYNSIVPHYVSCLGDTPASIYAVLYFPD